MKKIKNKIRTGMYNKCSDTYNSKYEYGEDYVKEVNKTFTLQISKKLFKKNSPCLILYLENKFILEFVPLIYEYNIQYFKNKNKISNPFLINHSIIKKYIELSGKK